MKNSPTLSTSASPRLGGVLAFLLLGALCLPWSAVNAQVVADGQTNTLNNVTNSVVGNVVIGTNGSFTLLTITNGALLTNSGLTSIGLNSGANSNSVLVTGPSSRWSGGGAFRVGNDGSGNRLVVSDGGTVASAVGTIGNNAGSSNNLAVITGTGSLWIISGNLRVGNDGSGNRLIVSNGGTVSAANVFVGNTTNSTNNRVVVDGGTLFATNAGGGAALDIRDGTNVLNAGLIETDNLLLTNSAGFFDFNGGTLITRGATISNGQDFAVGLNAGFANAIWDVRSNATPTMLTGRLFIGSNAANATLLITNGGTLRVTGGYGYLGLMSGASNNVAVVAGAGSLWTNSGNLAVGNLGGANQLVVSNGGVVANSTGYLGIDTSSSDNVVMVTGAGSLWTNRNSLIVGFNGSGNQLVVSNGGVVANLGSSIGNSTNAHKNQALVTGAGSLWTSRNDLLVGDNGSENRLVVSSGGVVASSAGFVGQSSTADSNLVVVTGADSLWTNSSDLWIGYVGSANRLLVANGGVVANGFGHLGSQGTASNNLVMVTGDGSLWINSSNLFIGSNGVGNQLVVSNGGVVANFTSYLGYLSGASNNMALVTGLGSRWTNGGDLIIGYTGSGNQLVVSNGGLVKASGLTAGFAASSLNNRVVVDGGAAIVTNFIGTAAYDVRRGTNELNAGLIVADNLLLTNSAGRFNFNGGTFNVGSATVSNGVPFAVGNGTSAATNNFIGGGTRTFGSGLIINSNATVSFGAGVLNSSAITNRNGAPFTVGNGTSNATFNLLGNGTHSFSNTLVIASNATLTGNGTITGSVTNFGSIVPGSSAGSIRINGDLNLKPSATMTFELGGLIATNQYDQVNVTNFVQFAGTLSLSLINNFLPGPADLFTLVKFNTSSGVFNNGFNGGRVSLANNLASFHLDFDNNLVLSDVKYVDSDGDGQGDLQEIAAGTDPLSQASELKVTTLARNVVGQITVTFQSVAGKTYRIEYSTNLVTWPIATTNVPATGTTTQWLDDGSLTGGLNAGTTKRFYRVGLQ